MFDHLKIHTSKLFATWALGTITWAVDATHIVGFFGACVGLFAGFMLVCIRWDDFWNSKPVKFLRERFSRPQS